MKTISKSAFVTFKKCPRFLWLLLNKPEEYVEDNQAQKWKNDGIVVGKLAKQYFSDTKDVSVYDKNGSLEIEKNIQLTNFYLKDGTRTIAEASFSIDGLFCSIDLLHPVEGGYEIYEVKASTNVKKEHLIDLAFQKYVLEKCGLNIVNTYILHLNNEYLRKGEVELDKLFTKYKVDFDPIFLQTLRDIDNDIQDIKSIISSEQEPDVQLLSRCKDCEFQAHCQKHLPKPCVLDVNGLFGYKHLNNKIITYSDLLFNNVELNKRQKVQVETYLKQKEFVVDKAGIQSFLDTIWYPIYHLDFESIQLPIPQADDTWAFEQIPTQYSLHIEYKNGRLEHKEFLGDSIDPRRAIAEALCRDIPEDGCVLVFNIRFERDRIDELANLFPDLKEHLTKIKNNIVDLLVPFKSGDYYHKNMGGSNSIKAVLPALYPNDPELDYHALPVVHDGGEAMDIYPKMLLASPKEKEEIRQGLLQYCRLDTLAMVKILRKIKESIISPI